jgi:hypothetical protein
MTCHTPDANVCSCWVSNWLNGFNFAWQLPDSEPEGPGLVWRETSADYWSGS